MSFKKSRISNVYTSIKGKICEIRLSVPGPVIYASSNKASFEAGVAETADNLERKLESHKEKWEPQRHSSIKNMA
jgi:ribosome-associated inhibitor A